MPIGLQILIFVLFFITFILWILGTLAPSIVRPIFRKDVKRKRVFTVFGIATMVLFVATVIAARSANTTELSISESPAPSQEIAKEKATPVATKIALATPTSKASSIGITRRAITSLFEKPAIGFSFENGSPVNGQENYVGSKGGSHVQLIGPADSLTQASIVAIFGSDDLGRDVVSISAIIGFVRTIDPSAIDWTYDQFEKVKAGPKKEYSTTKVFNNREFDFSYTPDLMGFKAIEMIVKVTQ